MFNNTFQTTLTCSSIVTYLFSLTLLFNNSPRVEQIETLLLGHSPNEQPILIFLSLITLLILPNILAVISYNNSSNNNSDMNQQPSAGFRIVVDIILIAPIIWFLYTHLFTPAQRYQNFISGTQVSSIQLCMVGALGGGNMFQANQSGMAVAALGQQLHWTWLSNPQVYGLALALAVAAVIIGGLQRIAQVAATIVPTMVVLYLAAALWIVGHHLNDIPWALGQIWHSAWYPTAIEGGIVGVMVQGLQRGVFSNGAGTGAAAIAHAATKNPEPVREGIVSLLEPLIDTVIICNLTALVCLLTGVYRPGSVVNGIELTSTAFASEIPMMTWGLAIIVCLFSFSTIISCFYYGEACWRYLLGNQGLFAYKLLYVLGSFAGTIISLDTVIRFSDIMVFALGIPNMIGLLLLSNQVAHSLTTYWHTAQTSAQTNSAAT